MVRLELPVLFCPNCGGQLVTHLCVVEGTEPPVLVCLFCARDRHRAGGAVRAVTAGWATGWAPPLDDRAAAALLVGLGATAADGHVDAVTGESASRAEVTAALQRELGVA